MPYSSLNRVVLIGRLTRDPELRGLPSGDSICSLRVACSGQRKGPDGEYQKRPDFFNVNVFGNQGETIHRLIGRGQLVAIDGRLGWHEWEAPDGKRREAVEILGERVQFLNGPSSGDNELLAPDRAEEPEPVL